MIATASSRCIYLSLKLLSKKAVKMCKIYINFNSKHLRKLQSFLLYYNNYNVPTSIILLILIIMNSLSLLRMRRYS